MGASIFTCVCLVRTRSEAGDHMAPMDGVVLGSCADGLWPGPVSSLLRHR